VTSNRSQTGKQRYPALSGRLIIDTYRGQTRVRAWPRKRGPHTIPDQIIQTQWFKAANKLALTVAPSQIAVATEATRNTGLYPRDVIIRAMGAGLLDIIEPDGTLVTYRQKFWERVVFQGTIIRPTVDIVPAVGVWFLVNWPLPVIDTAGFWNVAVPARLTVPDHVDIIKVHGDIKQMSTGGPLLAIRIRLNGTLDVAWSQATSSGTVGDHFSTGPIPVVQGDYFECLIFPTRAGNLTAGPTWWGVEILETSL